MMTSQAAAVRPEPFDPTWLILAAERCGVDAQTAEAAGLAVRSGRVVGLAVSGKLAAGKDTIAAAVMDHLGVAPLEHCFFSRPLKAELDAVLSILRRGLPDGAAVNVVTSELGIPTAAARTLTDGLTAAAADPSVGATTRTAEIRWALQFLGTDVRRTQDPDWWAYRSLGDLLRAFAAGRSVFFSDCRFPNEVAFVQRAGCFAVRLDISPEVQAQRLWGRDGLVVDPVIAAHPSETALDDYAGFDLRVDNDCGVDATVEAVVTALVAHAASLRA